MSEGFTIANFRHVADGLQAGQFSVGERRPARSLAELDPIYRQLLDRPVTMTSHGLSASRTVCTRSSPASDMGSTEGTTDR